MLDGDSKEGDTELRASLKALVEAVMRVVGTLRADTVDDSRARLVESCLRAVKHL